MNKLKTGRKVFFYILEIVLICQYIGIFIKGICGFMCIYVILPLFVHPFSYLFYFMGKDLIDRVDDDSIFPLGAKLLGGLLISIYFIITILIIGMLSGEEDEIWMTW